MSSGWKRFTGGECPICAGARQDCRQSLRTNLIHCRYPAANPSDYLYLREDGSGFGMWQLGSDRTAWIASVRELSAFEREQRRLEYLGFEKQRSEELAARYNSSLSIAERD